MSFPLPPAALLYPHACTIYRKTENLNVITGVFEDFDGAVLASAVACYFQTGESVKGPNEFITDEEDNLFTLDIIHFADTVDVSTGDVLKQTTGPDAGRYYEVRGDAKMRTQFAQKLTVRGSRIPAAPDWVP